MFRHHFEVEHCFIYRLPFDISSAGDSQMETFFWVILALMENHITMFRHHTNETGEEE